MKSHQHFLAFLLSSALFDRRCQFRHCPAVQDDYPHRSGRLPRPQTRHLNRHIAPVDGKPRHDTVKKIYDNLDQSRALQAYLLAIPIVNQAECATPCGDSDRITRRM